MKNLLMLTIFFFTFSCDNDVQEQVEPGPLEGKWKWKKTYGSELGKPFADSSSMGHSYTIIFSGEELRLLEDNDVIFNSLFSIAYENDNSTIKELIVEEEVNYIHYLSYSGPITKFSNDSLIFTPFEFRNFLYQKE